MASPAEAANMLLIASLGSSFAAGPDIPPQIEPKSAMRSGRNYPNLLAIHLDAILTDRTVSGATLLNITTEEQQTFGDTFPTQLSGLPDYTNIKPAAREIDPSPLTPSQLEERLGEVLDEIHKRAPRAHVFLVEYLAVLGPDTKPERDIPLTQERIDYHRNVASILQNAYVVAAKARSPWCERVPIHELSQGHALGSKEPWVGSLTSGPLLHPNATGMKVIADILIDRTEKILSSKTLL
ncbi:hypothetical protein N7541_001982 [Penicillium brevicompactum]|uniref:SGNH hydrolase-type esterase domain-containing protein n=1 Tax=Penicillium brevicompactum TaxID=5074 RepID=A0A9W9RP05_PENBR|nr:hypothetical protein N7541_001982 [Penicillium brevicompactum]